ncbi:thermonuclease family protein [Catenovulum sp. SM1970]|nr:thermonuclease family protein [Marinifaba aquimaris]
MSAFTLSCLCFSAPLFAKTYQTINVDQVLSIYDGDTFRVNLKDYPALVGENIPIRVNGVDTPEIRGKCKREKQLARKAKQFTVNQLRNAEQIKLVNVQRGKYFRIAADVMVDGQNLADLLIKANLGYPYTGGKKKPWC